MALNRQVPSGVQKRVMALYMYWYFYEFRGVREVNTAGQYRFKSIVVLTKVNTAGSIQRALGQYSAPWPLRPWCGLYTAPQPALAAGKCQATS